MNSPLRKFFAALMLMLIVHGGCEAAEFTREQVDQMMTFTVQNPAVKKSATLPVDAEAFRKNFNDFITDFISGTSAGTDAFMMKKIFLIEEIKAFKRAEGNVFAKNFLNKVAIVGLSNDGNCKVINFFAAPLEDKNDALFNALILQAFISGITPGVESTTLLDEIKRSPTESAVYNGVRYSVTGAGNLNVVTAIAAQ